MNASIDPLSLVNTHGAFGSVDREWHEVALDGTTGDALSGPAEWLEHECQRKPGDRTRRPCLITPC